MPRLLVNPGTSDAWEIELVPGPNRIGSSESNDFQINHPSVSGFHCEFVLSDAGVLLKDLGSARGTYINGEPVKEAFLQPGQHIQLGSVALVYEPPMSGPVPTAAQVMVAAPTPAPAPVVMSTPGGGTEVFTGQAFIPALGTGANFCKVHPDRTARFFCNVCRSFFCDECVATHAADNCVAVVPPPEVHRFGNAEPEDFFARLPRALGYPFRGNGPLILIAGTLVFAGLALLNEQLYGKALELVALAYLFAFLQTIVVATASDLHEVPELPGMQALFKSVLAFVGTMLVSFGPALVLALVKFKYEVALPDWGLPAAVVFGCAYFPMAFLGVTIKDSSLAANPLTVLPAIFKTLLPYLVSVGLMLCIFQAARFSTQISSEARATEQATQSFATVLTIFATRAAWSCLAVYLLTVNMRILGLIYVTRKQKFGWFGR